MIARRPHLAALAFLIGTAYALTFLDSGFIAGRSVYWTQAFGDRITNLVGALYFIRDEWRFPLFYVPQLAFPEGANIVYTDSVPLFALFLKGVYKVSGEWFNYFGLWLFLCFPLLALFAALAVLETGMEDALAASAAALLAVSSPAFLARFGHAALMGHFLIAWSLWLYLRLRKRPDNLPAIGQFCAAAAVAILVQAYFLLMVVPFCFAALAQAAVERRLAPTRAAASAVVMIAAILATAFLAGIVGPGTGQASAWGFGHYSMNLLSPFIPPRDHLPAFVARRITWDGNGYSWDATGGQYEGYSYFGAGLLLLGAVHLVASRRLLALELRQHAFLVAALMAYLLLAVSNRIFIGDRLLAQFPVPSMVGELTGRFRTSGRLFWPVYYVLAVGLVVITVRRFRPPVARALVIGAVALQLVDTQMLRRNIASETSHGFPQALPRNAWQALLERHQRLYQYPSFQCGGFAGRWPENNSNMELLRLAAELAKPTNSAYLARLTRDCSEELREGLAFDIDAGGLYVFAGTFPISRIEERPTFRAWCREFEYGVVCSRNWVSDPGVIQAFRPIQRSWVPLYLPSHVLQFSAGGTGVQFLGGGWWVPESWGTWSMGAGEITLRVSPRPAEDLVLAVSAHAFVHPARAESDVAVIANEREVAVWHFRQGEGIKKLSADIPRALLQEDGVLRLRFLSKNIESPKQAGVAADPRAIGFGLADLAVSPLSIARR